MPVAGSTLYVLTKINGRLIKRTQSAFLGHFIQIAHVMTGITAPIQKEVQQPRVDLPKRVDASGADSALDHG